MKLRVRAPRIIERPFAAAQNSHTPAIVTEAPKVKATIAVTGNEAPRTRFGGADLYVRPKGKL